MVNDYKVGINDSNTPIEDIRTRKCLCCDKVLPIEEFGKFGIKYFKVCKTCKNIVKQGNNLASYTTQQMLRELSSRGVHGKFTYTRVETIEI